MTAPEPLTLVELVRYLGGHDYWLGYDSSGMYIAMPVDGNSPAACGTGSTPWEAASEAMPERQVAPRDEAAELRAAVTEMSDLVYTIRHAEEELGNAPLLRDMGASTAHMREAIENAWERLCALAALHDGTSALAASEGES